MASAERTAQALDSWFTSLRQTLDGTVFSVAADERRRRAAALGVVTRHVFELEEAAGQPAIQVRETAWVLAGATRWLAMMPGLSQWRAAVRNVVSLDARLDAMPKDSPWVEDVAAIFRSHMLETLRQAGVARVPTILNAQNRRVALGLSVNWGMRYLVAGAAGLAEHEVDDPAAREVVAAVSGGLP
ncbi:MAG: hypothetical protein GXP55_23965 [Deltaproteobacteria bacterium]|nr:hypothetical protein [Deltaproteobacteria bacterium]